MQERRFFPTLVPQSRRRGAFATGHFVLGTLPLEPQLTLVESFHVSVWPLHLSGPSSLPPSVLREGLSLARCYQCQQLPLLVLLPRQESVRTLTQGIGP